MCLCTFLFRSTRSKRVSLLASLLEKKIVVPFSSCLLHPTVILQSKLIDDRVEPKKGIELGFASFSFCTSIFRLIMFFATLCSFHCSSFWYTRYREGGKHCDSALLNLLDCRQTCFRIHVIFGRTSYFVTILQRLYFLSSLFDRSACFSNGFRNERKLSCTCRCTIGRRKG